MTKTEPENIHWVPGYLTEDGKRIWGMTACGHAIVNMFSFDVSEVTCSECREDPEFKERLLKWALEQ
jgi:hypothetical protein